jgi:tetratricopeptide (TPR) repeat protein
MRPIPFVHSVFASASSIAALAPVLVALALPAVMLCAPESAAQDVAIERRESRDALTAPQPGIDQSFSDLRRTRDPQEANGIANRIVAELSDSHSPTINLLMNWADNAIGEKRNAAAFDFLDQAIALQPDFVGAWNKRATLNFTLGSYRKAMEDIKHVLALEPRHFGALAGMAAILSESGRDEAALKAWQRYLDIYPADRQAQDVVSKLSEKLAGSRT